MEDINAMTKVALQMQNSRFYKIVFCFLVTVFALSGCSGNTETSQILQESKAQDIANESTEESDENVQPEMDVDKYYPPKAFDMIERVDDGYWKVVASEWKFAHPNDPNPMYFDAHNQCIDETIPTKFDPPYIINDEGKQIPIPDTNVQYCVNPQTGKQIIATTTHANYLVENQIVYSYTVTFEGLVLYEAHEQFYGPGSPGAGFRWVDEEHISAGYFTDWYLYNITDKTYRALTYPLSEPTTNAPNFPARDRESLIHTDCTYLDAGSHAYIVTYIDGTQLEDLDYARDYGAGRQTLYYVNWETGVTFPFFENDYQPQGAGRPEYLTISYNFHEDGNFIFIVDNRYDVAGFGEDIGQIVYEVDVASQETSPSLEVPFGVMEAGFYGDYSIWITSFYSNHDYYAFLYNHKEKKIVREFRGEYHGSYENKYPVFVNREENVVSIFDFDNKNEYQLSLAELNEQMPGYQIDYNVHSLLIQTTNESNSIDYAKVLGLS